ncbi:MAG: PAS domain S-box protein [Candidatus Coatesbacteria bacterium]|nr:MAG: PAS domain S-box protein [Candidatus Coatesbacteria bacterium]
MNTEEYKTLFEKSPIPALYVVSKRVEAANEAAAKLFKRLGLGDPEGVDFGKLWPKGTKASGKRGLTELKGLKRGEYGITLPDDTTLAVEIRPFSRKKPIRTIVTLEDVTERKRAEEELRRHHGHLEELVEERTAELKKVNAGLEAEITEREQVEEELSKSETEKSAILENMSEYVVYTDKEMTVIWANRAVADWLKSAPDDLTGRKCYEIWFGRDRVCDGCHALTVFEKGKRVKCERKLSDGSIWDIMCEPVRDDSGAIIGAVEVSSDVTERRQAEEELRRHRDHLEELVHERTNELEAEIIERKRSEEALRESEEKYRNLIERSNDAVAIIQDGVIKFANERVTDIFGYSVDELIGKDFIDYIHPDEEAKLTDIYERRMSGKEAPSIYEMVLKNREGESVHVEINAGIVQYEGKPADFAFVRDITERKTAEEALRASEEKYRTLIENAGAPVTYLNLDGTVLLVNTVGARNLGGTPDDFVGKSIYELLPDMADKVKDRVRQVVESEAGCGFEDLVELPSGSHWFYSNHQPVKDAGGEVFAVQIVSQDITERKRAEEALRESEKRYALTTEAARVGVWDWDLATDDIYVDPKLKAMLGYEDDEITNRLDDWGRHIHPDDADRCFAEAQAHLRGEKPLYECEHRMLTKDGEVVWFLARGTALLDENGEPYRVVGTDTDITERKRAEEALRESEEKYRNLIERSNDAVAIIQDGKIRFANERVTGMVGYPVEELIGKDFIDYIHPDDVAKLTDIYERRMAGKAVPSIYETVLKNREGEPVHVEINAGVIQYEGKPADFAFVRDITERKATEEALTQSESKYHDLYNNAPVPYFTVDIKGRIIRAKKAAEYFTGYRLEELIEKKVSDLYAGESRAKAKRLFNKFKRGESWDNEEMVYLRKDGQKAYGSLSVSPVVDEDGRIIESRSVIIDITDTKKIELERNVVADVNQVLAASLDTFTTVSEVFNVLNRLFDFDRMSIAVLSDDRETFRVFEAIEKGESTPKTYETGTVLPAVGTGLSECASTRGILIVDDLKNSEFVETKELFKVGLRAVVLLPLIIGEKVLGTWNIGSKREGAFRDVPSGTLEELSSDIALWLEARLTYEKVASSEEQYRTLQTNVPVGVFRTTAEPGGRLISLNPALARMFGYESPEDMHDIRVSDLYLNPKDREKFIETISSAGAITDYEVEFKRTDGSSFWGSLSAQAVVGTGGDVTYLDGILEDITERKETELALADSEMRYRALYETTRALSVYADVDEVLTSIGEQAAILFGSYDCAIYTI